MFAGYLLRYGIINPWSGKKFRFHFPDSSMLTRFLHVSVCFGILAGLWAVGDDIISTEVFAQPSPKKMRVEEEEEPSKVPTKIEPENIVPTPARPSLPTGGFNIGEAAARAKNPHVKNALIVLTTPFDRLVSSTGLTQSIRLMPERQLPDGKFTYLLLNGQKQEVATGAGFFLKPYEEIVGEEVDGLLKKKLDGVRRDDALEVGVQLLQYARRFHAAAIEQKKRTGRGWEAVDDKLRQQVVGLRREQLKLAIDAKEWARADELTLDLSNFSEDAEVKKDIYRLLLRKAIDSLSPDRDDDYLSLREALRQFELIADGAGDPLTQTARRLLTKRSNDYIALAKKEAALKETGRALNLLKSADLFDPDNQATQTLRSTLRDRILYVGVPRIPKRLSPGTARDDAERWGVELIFENLLQAVPDPDLGRRYRPVLAEGLPGLLPLGREFSLHPNITWLGDTGKTVTAHDVLGTLESLRQSAHLPCAEGLEVFDLDRFRIEDPYRFRLSYRQGVLEPLNRTTFKILPSRYLKAKGYEAENLSFAKEPVGSGPFRYIKKERKKDDPESAIFVANPYYGQRDGKIGQPMIEEIHFVVVPQRSTLEDDLAKGRLHLVLDIPTPDLPAYHGPVKVHTLTTNRRVHMLAVNHRQTKLQSVDLRRGLAAAIDRETILKEVYRPEGVKSHHAALTGPFPLPCWATPEKARRSEAGLHNPDLAAGLLGAVAGKQTIELNLTCIQGDQLAERACRMMAEQIEKATKKPPADTPMIKVNFVPLPFDDFHEFVFVKQSFDLAYLPYDYKDDQYSLGGLLDRTADASNGRNFLGYLAPGTNPHPDDQAVRIAIDSIRAHRDFRDSVREETWKLHTRFLTRMPFIPLWQLDRHIAVHSSLELSLDGSPLLPERIDPATVFNGVESWKLK